MHFSHFKIQIDVVRRTETTQTFLNHGLVDRVCFVGLHASVDQDLLQQRLIMQEPIFELVFQDAISETSRPG